MDAFDQNADEAIRAWLADAPAGLVLNVGGPRQSEVEGIYKVAVAMMATLEDSRKEARYPASESNPSSSRSSFALRIRSSFAFPALRFFVSDQGSCSKPFSAKK